MRPDVIVIGAGIAGLAAAYELHTRRVPFLLIERAPRAGGVILTEQIDGFTVEAGPDALLVQKPDAIKLCDELGIAGRLVSTLRPRRAYIQRGGRLHPIPEASVLGIPTRVGPFLGSRLFSWPGKMRMGLELFVPPRRSAADESIGAFIGRRFGDEAVAYLAEPLLAGIHAGDVDRLSIGALFPRFVEAERRHGSLLRAFRAQRPRTHATGLDDGAFRSFPGGLSELVCAVANALPRESTRLGVGVNRIEEGSTYDLDTTAGKIGARAVIVATNASVTSALLRPLAAGLADLVGGVPYGSTATISFGFDRSQIQHPLDGSGYLVPRAEDNAILAVSWMSSKWPHRAPQNKALLRVFVGGARNPDALSHSDAELVHRALGAIAPVLGITGDPSLTRVYRFDRASAQHEVGHLERVRRIDAALAEFPGLYLIGSGLRVTGIPDCIADARAHASKAAAYVSSHAD